MFIKSLFASQCYANHRVIGGRFKMWPKCVARKEFLLCFCFKPFQRAIKSKIMFSKVFAKKRFGCERVIASARTRQHAIH